MTSGSDSRGGTQPTPSIADLRAAQRMAVLLGTAGAVIALASFLLYWGVTSVRAAMTGVDWWAPFLVPLAALACIPIHESLHYLGFRMAGAPGEQIRFGFDPQVGPFCGCTAPLRLRGYLVAIVLPVIVLGVCSYVRGSMPWSRAACRGRPLVRRR